ncbi:hypothetical protein [Clostridium sp.]|uniref:hypothetical protein n=1 Tax=Clostridium sp. TaxID=1506 RepID=UPI0028529E87|nr:hypothetical protein [Clostridium sp.]
MSSKRQMRKKSQAPQSLGIFFAHTPNAYNNFVKLILTNSDYIYERNKDDNTIQALTFFFE